MLNIKIKRRLARVLSHRKTIISLALLIIIAGWLYYATIPIRRYAYDNGFRITFLYDLFLAKSPPLKAVNNRANILLLGMGGANHEGPDLTDSILVVSIALDRKDMAFISLPRDIWSPTLKDKINSAYHYGEGKKTGGGLILAKSIAEEVTGLPINYAATIDFAGFDDIVDLLGGVDVTVDHPFTDDHFPITGKEDDECNGDPTFACRYKTITFNKGLQHMNGQQALEFVRSRYAQGAEGNDYARGQRQQKILMAVKDKIMKERLFLNLHKMTELYAQFHKVTTSDLTLAEMLYLVKLIQGIKTDQIRHIAIAEGGDNGELHGFLINPPTDQYNGVWVLTPKDEDFTQIHEYLDCKVNKPDCTMTFPKN